jgi:hypothetical protein
MASAVTGIMTRRMAGFDGVGGSSQKFLKIHGIRIDRKRSFILMVVSVRIIVTVHPITVVIPIPPAVLWIVLTALLVLPAEGFFRHLPEGSGDLIMKITFGRLDVTIPRFLLNIEYDLF